jgi:hypothetical protein
MDDNAADGDVAVEPAMETDGELQKWADHEKCALLAFIAPYSGVRVNPISEAYASIGVHEEFGIESFLEKCKEKRTKKLHMLVNSPGGSVVSSYKVAKALRAQFDHIRVFVPHIAASGGTLIALTGNEIVMGIMSHLTPLDPQVPYKGTYISANTFLRSFERFKSMYGQMQSEEAPYPIRCMTEKLDPLVMEEMSGISAACIQYVREILESSGYEAGDAFEKACYLATAFRDHSTVLGPELLTKQGFKVVSESKHQKEWEQMRLWLRKYIGRSDVVHHMRYCLPKARVGGLARMARGLRANVEPRNGSPRRPANARKERSNGKV